MNGLAITAGSNPSFLASIGRVDPTNLANIIVIISVRHTTAEVVIPIPSI